MATAITTLKSYFENGKKPTEQEFAELIDAFVHRNDDLQSLLGAIAEVFEAEEGIVNDKYMTPFLTKKAIEALVRLSELTDLASDVQGRIDAAINALVDSAPETLDTLKEIAEALNNDDDAYTSLLAKINDRYTKDELDAFFEGTASGKKQVDWSRITGKPNSFTPDVNYLYEYFYTNSIIDYFFEGTTEGKKLVDWRRVINKPDEFNPSYHSHSWSSITGKPAGITATRKVRDEEGFDETVIIEDGVITSWGNLSQQQQQQQQQAIQQNYAPNCIALDTPILMADGSTQTLENLKVGEEVQSVYIPGLTEQNYTSWQGSLDGMKRTVAKVISKTLYNGESCLLINGSLKMTAASEYVLCRKQATAEWQFVTADQLEQGDYLMDSGLNEITVDSIKQVNEPLDLGHINVEPDDLFFGHGIIIHNTEEK